MNTEILHKMVYAEKKVTKVQIKNINIVFTLESIDENNLTLRQASIIILALSRILNKKMSSLIEECNHLLSQVTRERPLKVPSNKNITLNIESTAFIKDDMIDLEESDLIAMETSILEECPAFEVEFGGPDFNRVELDFGGDVPSIEQARESTLLNSTGIFNETTVTVKRRRMAEDRNIEIDETVFRANLRNVGDLLMKVKRTEPRGIEISPKVEEFFRRHEERIVFEEERNNSVGFEPDFPAARSMFPEADIKPADGSAFPEAETEPAQSENMSVEMRQIFTELPENFVFNFVVQNFNKIEKAEWFLELLMRTSKGEVKVLQEEAFSNIECVIIK